MIRQMQESTIRRRRYRPLKISLPAKSQSEMTSGKFNCAVIRVPSELRRNRISTDSPAFAATISPMVITFICAGDRTLDGAGISWITRRVEMREPCGEKSAR
jgi:hypothetical protein